MSAVVHQAVVQDARLDIRVRLAEMNARHRQKQFATYTALESLAVGAVLLGSVVAMIFVWAA